MQWQDLVFSIGNWMFSVALIPTILGKEKPALSTSTVNSVVLFIFGFAFTTLSLWLSAASISLNGILWAILAFQKYRKDKK